MLAAFAGYSVCLAGADKKTNMPTIRGARKLQFQDLFEVVGTAFVTTNPADAAAGDFVDVTTTVTGAAFGDFVLCSVGIDPLNNMVHGYVSAANTVTLRVFANDGATAGQAIGALNARVIVLRANPNHVSA